MKPRAKGRRARARSRQLWPKRRVATEGRVLSKGRVYSCACGRSRLRVVQREAPYCSNHRRDARPQYRRYSLGVFGR